MPLRLFELEPSWITHCPITCNLPYISNLAAFVERERAANIPIFPPKELVFNAFRKTPYDKVNVVIMGQDPLSWPWTSSWAVFQRP